ncbi:MAG: hypothetical protein ACNI3H_00560 [Halarcobacter ebronensis]|uniref:hypothetical protein n=1 Tax=Halarcobacter ebronensis TaxID=1462615 RepID=UPI003C790748
MKKSLLILGAAIIISFSGCSDIQNKLENTLSTEKKEEITYRAKEVIDLDTRTVQNMKEDPTFLEMWKETTFSSHKGFRNKNDFKKFIINNKLYEVRYDSERGNEFFNLYDLEEKKNVITFEYRYAVTIFDDTDINGKLYFGLKKIYNGSTTYNKFDKIFSFDGKELKQIKTNVNEKSMYLGKTRIISFISYFNKYIIYTINTKNYNRYEVVNILNDKETRFKATLLAIKHNKVLLLRKTGSSLFKTRQYELVVLNLDTDKETVLMRRTTRNNNDKLSFFESKSQLITKLPNNEFIDIVSMRKIKNVDEINKINKLKAKIYNVDKLYSEEYNMTLEELSYSIDYNYDDTKPVLYK